MDASDALPLVCPSPAVLQIELLDSRKDASPKPRAHRLGLGRIDPHRHPDPAGLFVGRFVKNFGVTVKPADAGPVNGIEHKLDQNAAGRELRFDSRIERIGPLPGYRRHPHRPSLRRTTLREISQPILGVGIEPVDLVPDFDQRRLAGLAARIDAELA